MRREQLSIGIERHPHGAFLLARLVRRGQILQPILNPLEWAPQQYASRNHRNLFAPGLSLEAE